MAQEQHYVAFPLLHTDLLRIIDASLAEDLTAGDATTDYLIQPNWHASGSIMVKDEGTLAGMPVSEAAFKRVDPAIEFRRLLPDGSKISRGMIVGEVEGPAASILKAERVALNFLQRLSGVATETARMVEAVRDLPVRITETRKTTPGLRFLEKYAVRVGGGYNHRLSLNDGVLIKDNHLEALRLAGMSIADAIKQVRRDAPHLLRIEVEVESAEQAREAAEAGADWILLDNMPPDKMREAVRIIDGRSMVEASGGITWQQVRAVAESGVNLISSGALTHSYRALDISLDLEYRIK